MEAVRFKQFLVCDTKSAKTLEDNAKALFSYAGIHDRDFDDELNDAFASLDDTAWNTGDASGTWAIESGQLKGTGSGSSNWQWLMSEQDMPSEGVLSVYKNGNEGAIYFCCTGTRSDGYMFFWDASGVGFKKGVSSTWSTMVYIPKVYTGEGDITLAWREQKFSSVDDYKWLFFSAWVDGELAITWKDDITTTTPAHRIGFGVKDSDTIYFDDARIAELTEVIDWCSLDIGEAPANGLSRLIGGRHINYFLRYDGTLRMWRPKSTTSTWTYQRHMTGFNREIDVRALASHYRQVGAWEQADVFSSTLLQKGIGRFHKANNPDLMTKEACYDEANYAITRLRENAERCHFSVPAQVLQEPEDVVTVYFERDDNTVINNDLYYVDIRNDHTITFNDDKLTAVLHLRRKV